MSHGERQQELPRGICAQSARPVRLPSGPPSSLKLYLPEPVYEALRKIAFDERVKIHDVVLEGIDLSLRRRGYPSVESLKAGKKR